MVKKLISLIYKASQTHKEGSPHLVRHMICTVFYLQFFWPRKKIRKFPSVKLLFQPSRTAVQTGIRFQKYLCIWKQGKVPIFALKPRFCKFKAKFGTLTCCHVHKYYWKRLKTCTYILNGWNNNFTKGNFCIFFLGQKKLQKKMVHNHNLGTFEKRGVKLYPKTIDTSTFLCRFS